MIWAGPFYLWVVSKGLLIKKTGKTLFVWLTPICWQQILFMWLRLLYSWLPISVLAKGLTITYMEPNAIFYLQRSPSYSLLGAQGQVEWFQCSKIILN
jgi:hypothetical protein